MEKEKSIVWLDLETTGVNTVTDRIIEICLIKTDLYGNEIAKFYSLVNPGSDVEIKPEAFAKHGISKQDLEDQDGFGFIASEIISFIGDSYLGGYNILYFDIPMLVQEFLRAGVVFEYRDRPVIDPFLIYTKYEPRNLESVYKRLTGKDLEGAHRAENDILATIEIFDRQREIYELPETIEELDSFVNESRKDMVDISGKLKFAEIDGKREIVFNFGKWKGISFRRVFEKDKNYIEWMYDKGEFSKDTKIIVKKLLDKCRQEYL
jgi:DNA polymerase-3 subunit epsilon